MSEPKLNKGQQKRLDSIVQKHLDYIDNLYDTKEKPKIDSRKARQDISLPEPKKKPKKKPNYGSGKCTHPGCGVEFEKNSGVQTNCSKHRKPPKYTPIDRRKKENGS